MTPLPDVAPLEIFENGTIIIEPFFKKLLGYATASGGLSWSTPVSEIEKILTNVGGALAEVDSATYTLAEDGLSVAVFTDDTKTTEVTDNSLYWVYAPIESEESTIPEIVASYDINKAASDAATNARALKNSQQISESQDMIDWLALQILQLMGV